MFFTSSNWTFPNILSPGKVKSDLEILRYKIFPFGVHYFHFSNKYIVTEDYLRTMNNEENIL